MCVYAKWRLQYHESFSGTILILLVTFYFVACPVPVLQTSCRGIDLGVWYTCLRIDVTLGRQIEHYEHQMAPTSTFLSSRVWRRVVAAHPEPLAINGLCNVLFCCVASGPASRLSIADNTFHIPFVRRHTLLLYISLARSWGLRKTVFSFGIATRKENSIWGAKSNEISVRFRPGNFNANTR